MGSITTEGWQQTAAAKQKSVLDSIPAKWRLKQSTHGMKDVRNVPKDSGLLTPQQLAITEKTTTELVEDLAQRRLSSVEVTEAFCARAAVAHQCVNCLTAVYFEEAIEHARALDEILRTTGKPVGPLHGLPIAIKEIMLVKDKPATFGLVAWAEQRGEFDASIVKVLKTAGIVHIATTTMPQTGMMLQTVSPLYGRTLNPFNRDFSAGGSSGGDGSLVAMRGSPFCPSTDIGGSIRAPGAFNGLYAIRPTSERIPKYGMLSPAPGNTSIKVSCGPTCHSVQDLELVTRLLIEHKDYIGYEPTATSIPWRDVTTDNKLVLAMLKTDGVVMPQPPILRALSETATKLRAAGHTVIEIDPPIDLWDAALVTWKLYFQTGGKEIKSLMASTGEPVEKCFQWYQETFKIKELTVSELFQANIQQAAIKREFAHFWDSTKKYTSNGRPIDGLVCPAAPSASFPHDFMVWWGYFSIWNLLDYPSTILPLKYFNISVDQDPKDTTYTPKDNPFDGLNHDIYDPELWRGLPVSLQIVRQQFDDEELLKVTEVVDDVVNRSRSG